MAARAGPVVIELFPEQAAFVADQAYAVAAVCGVGSGKSRSGAVKLLVYLIDHPGALAIVTAPTFPILRDATLRAIFEVWPRGVRKNGDGWLAGEMRLELANGSQVLFRSTDDPDHLRGPNAAIVWMDEAAFSPLEAFRVLQGRLRQVGYPGCIFLTTTPSPQGYGWVFDEFEKAPKEGFRLHRWSLRANPYVDPEYLKRLEESYDESQRLREIEGIFQPVGGHTQFDAEWLREQIALARDVKPVADERGLLVKLWSPYDRTHQYALGIDPKAAGNDLGYGLLLDFTFGSIMGMVRSQHKDAGALREACMDVAKTYSPRLLGSPNLDEGCLVIPETNGVGAEFAFRMREAGCRVFRRPARPGENRDTDAFRHRNWGWNTDAQTRPLMIGTVQNLIRQHRLSSPIAEFWHALGAWDPETRVHMPDIGSAGAVAVTGSKLLWGEMGSTVAQAARLKGSSGPMWRAGGGVPMPFRVA